MGTQASLATRAGVFTFMVGLGLFGLGISLGTNVADTRFHPAFEIGLWTMGAALVVIFLALAVHSGRAILATIRRTQIPETLTRKGTDR